MHQGEPGDEYKDVSDNIRLFQNIRFAQLTVFIAVSATLIGVVFSSPSAISPPLMLLLKLGGLLVTVLFWVLMERTMLYWRHFVSRAAELEELLGYKQYSTAPQAGLITGTNAIRGFFIVVCLLWIALLVVPG
jgi:hypothetical protein